MSHRTRTSSVSSPGLSGAISSPVQERFSNTGSELPRNTTFGSTSGLIIDVLGRDGTIQVESGLCRFRI